MFIDLPVLKDIKMPFLVMGAAGSRPFSFCLLILNSGAGKLHRACEKFEVIKKTIAIIVQGTLHRTKFILVGNDW